MEKFEILSFALPSIRDVRVVTHQHQQPALIVEDAENPCIRALDSALRRLPAAAAPELDRGDLGDLIDK